jgi:pimeloyl-[acyl-carrier protein] methyl ester esterase
MSAGVFDALRRDLTSGWQVQAGDPSSASSTPVGLSPGWRTHAVDLPGHGGPASPEPYTLDALVRSVAETAPARCVVLGWSLGALVALTWAAHAAEQVERLVIIAGTPCFVRRTDWAHGVEPAVFDAFARDLRLDRDHTLRRFAALQAHGDKNSKEVTRALGAETGARVSDEGLQDGLRILLESDVRPYLKSIAQRALLIHGMRDELVPIAAAEYLAANLRGAALELIEGAAHAPFLSAPSRVAQRIAGFLDE